MNIMNKLTRKHMQTNKKRTLVTILGIIISVAMFTAVTTGSASVMDLFQRFEMEDSGHWHVEYLNVTKDVAKQIEKDGNTENLSLSNELGYSLFPDSLNEDKPYVYIMEMDTKGFSMMNVELVSGRLPQNDGEVLIPEHLLKFSKQPYSIGDTIEVDLGNRFTHTKEGELSYLNQDSWYQDGSMGEKEQFEPLGEKRTLTVVGVMERPKLEYYSAPGFTIMTGLSDSKDPIYTAKVYVDQVDADIYKDSKALANQLSIDIVKYNNSLLKYYGVSFDDSYNKMIFYMEVILIIIIMVGSVSLIYNSFAISISERTKQFGMLSSVGTTKRQKMHAVLYEGLLSGCFSIPLGVIAGLLGIGVTFWVIGPMFKKAFQMEIALRMVVSVEAIVLAVVVSIITILISAYLPARKASKITAMEAIRQQKDIKVSPRTFKTSKLNRKLFGLEGDLASKNLKRNKKRYRVLVFSLSISIVLFISVNAYTHYLSAAVELTGVTNEGDVSISNLTYEEVQKIMPYLMELDTLSDLTTQYNFHIDYELSKENSERYSTKAWKEFEGKDNKMIDLYVTALNDTAFSEYAKVSGIDIKNGGEAVSAIIINRQRDTIQYTINDLVPVDIQPETVLNAKVKLYEENVVASKEELAFCVLGTTDKLPLGMSYFGRGSMIQVVIAESSIDLLPTINGAERTVPYTRISCNTNAPDRITGDLTEIMDREIPHNEGSIYNGAEEVQRSRQMVTVFNVFAYGFIALISLISIANMCNTISTSFSVRRSEFAMLKSVGMTPRAFKKMIVFESLLYGIKALLFGLPLGMLFNYAIYKSVSSNFSTEYAIPYSAYLIAVISVFVVVAVAMLYSTSKTRKDNIIDGLKSEII